ncbi:RNA polymerase sigma factor [Nocardioides anomalus]|uniref:RNA polymerase sigma factor n=1 Tax=Nocardioides anomalus TaxID=2712223 RepID=A0A6G6W8N1_9ACTN|nr:RNA polymerase sigma factor [Nocardioides anomalus]QIG41584.1 RNA polymerase sigma factor [Nocardioides anomalus]
MRPPRDPDADQRLSALYAAHAARLFAYARRHGDPATAEDLVADAFEVVVRRLADVPLEPGDARAWLVGVVRKLAANRRRREATAQEWWRAAVRDGWHGRAGASAEEVVAERDACLHALAALSPKEREALLLVAWDGLTPDQAARVLGVTPNAFSVRLHRARKRLTARPTPILATQETR